MEGNFSFAQNLKRLRREKGLTQYALAQQLGYSEKTISKWEIGMALPDVPTLAQLADLWDMSLEELLYHAETGTYYLGIDGGGSKTVFLLCNASFEPVNRVELGPSNPNDMGTEQMLRVLSAGIRACCRPCQYRAIRVFAGISGAKTAGALDDIRQLCASFGFAAYYAGSDLDLILRLGKRRSKGMVMILGTGIMGIAYNGKHSHTVGGWGRLFDEGGSEYNYGRDAICAVLQAYDGSGRPTFLTQLCEQRLGKPIAGSIGELMQMSKAQLADFCEDVFTADAAGDKVAGGIIRRHTQSLVRLLDAGYDFVQEPLLEVAVAGSLVRHLPRLQKELAALPHKPVRLCEIKEEPVMGAVYLAAKEGV